MQCFQIIGHGGSVTETVTEATTQLVVLLPPGCTGRVSPGALLEAVATAAGPCSSAAALHAVHVLRQRLVSGDLHIVSES